MLFDGLPWSAEGEPRLQSALEILNRRRSRTPTLGLTSAVGCTCYCSLACLCSDQLEAVRVLTNNAPRVGLLLTEAGGQLAARICRAPRRPRAVQAAVPLVEWCALLTRPPYAFRCRNQPRAVAHQGLSAYDAWLDDIAHCARLSRKRRAGIEARAKSWRLLRRHGALFLDWAAGTRRSCAARYLRVASKCLLDEAEGPLTMLCDLPQRDALRCASESLSSARTMIDSATRALHLAALSLAGIDGALADELATLEPAPPTRIAQLVYLARTGVAPFRALAARRLGFAEDPQASATLGQLAWDPDPLVASTARWAAGNALPTGLATPPTHRPPR